MSDRSGFRGAAGPGILYAATAVGASHLVQSTRAGAEYGLALVLLIALTYVAKYPAFRFGAQFANATGTSLLQGYRRQGRWAVAIYVIVAIGTMFAAVPAVTLVTAGLAKAAFGLQVGTFAMSVLILSSCTVLLVSGGYRLLERVVKLLMAALAAATVVATALAIPGIDWTATLAPYPRAMDRADVFFIVALLGLMPSSVDISVWHSLWSVARSRAAPRRPSLAAALLDFHVGYAGTLVLALCFVLLGTAVMHGSGVQFAAGPTEFAAQLIGMYERTLGAWSGPFIGSVAVVVMLSTVLTGLDGYPRAAVELYLMGPASKQRQVMTRRVYALTLVLLVLGSLFIMYFFVTSLKVVVDVAATLMFLFAPLIAWLNHRVMLGSDIPEAARPSRGLRALSTAGIVCLGGFAAYYLYLRILA